MLEYLANEADGLEIDPAIATLFTVLLLIVFAALAVLLYFLIKRERNRYITEKLKNGVMNKTRFDDFVRRRIKIAKKTSRFAVAFIKILGDDDLYNSLGVKQYEGMLNALNERIYAVMPIGTKLCNYDQGVIAAFIDQNMDKKGLEDAAQFCINECRKPIELVTKVKVTVAIDLGVAAFDYYKNKDHVQYLMNAELALKTAEKAGANLFYVYTPELDFSEDEKYHFYRDMKKAEIKNEYVLHYGAIRALSGVVTGFYGKLYRDSAESGLIDGEKFIPSLVQSGEIINVGKRAFSSLCEAVYEYMYTTGKEPVFSYYATAREMSVQATAALMYKEVKSAKILPGEICVLTDEFKNENVLSSLRKLKDYGFLIGGVLTNENSADLVTAVEKLNFDRVDIPVSFIVGDKASYYYKGLAEMLGKLARLGGASVTATGVETREQMTEAAALGITDFIGFISNESVSAKEAEKDYGSALYNETEKTLEDRIDRIGENSEEENASDPEPVGEDGGEGALSSNDVANEPETITETESASETKTEGETESAVGNETESASDTASETETASEGEGGDSKEIKAEESEEEKGDPAAPVEEKEGESEVILPVEDNGDPAPAPSGDDIGGEKKSNDRRSRKRK